MKVFMYTLSTCPWCRKTKQFFKERNVKFDFVDYDLEGDKEQEKILEEMSKHTSNPAFPFVIIGKEVVVGYNPERYLELLKKGGGQ
jgi:glutaredoxin